MWEPKIGDIRRAKGLQQNFVAKQINVSPQSLSAWENGDAFPKANYLFELAEFLEVEVGDLYEKQK
ncbi:helix-turn-helix domain-containing protein [Radiobacillus deserti]|uniref:Helix-turn-helix transcriptional regulator n=1 Tax=Radiobacillus deserti TaxID=2594883 RepID=A0A516KHB4_9BACI|nr:helix-turn-helix transcriptional regulator [Radiobacillus deserti]QDP40791.1 helix-turn-helix transcriptional regulator [Radiobacillus deserti]